MDKINYLKITIEIIVNHYFLKVILILLQKFYLYCEFRNKHNVSTKNVSFIMSHSLITVLIVLKYSTNYSLQTLNNVIHETAVNTVGDAN